MAAWRFPLLCATLLVCAAATGEWSIAGLLALAGAVLHRSERLIVLEVSPVGLARGLMLGDRFTGQAHVLAWRSIDEITTDWRAPGDATALETVVRSRDAGSIRFTTAMGVSAYRRLLSDIVRHAPGARRTGLTGRLLAEGVPPAPRRLAGASAVLLLGAVLLLVLVLFVGGALGAAPAFERSQVLVERHP